MIPFDRHRLFVERLLIVVAVVLIAWVLWQLRSLLVILMGAIAFAVLLRGLADPINRVSGLGSRFATMIAVLIVAAVIGGAGYLFGEQASKQFAQMSDSIPRSWDALKAAAATIPMGERLLTSVTQGQHLSDQLTRAFGLITNAATTVLLIIFGAVFLAAQPELYVTGLIKLISPRSRSLAREALESAGRALRLWMFGQFISMVVVGILTGVGLWFAGVPSPLALALIAGLTESIPYLGPIIGSAPGLLLALAVGPDTALWALLVYVAVQNIEGYTLVPVIQRSMVSLPPALTLFWIIASGTLFGVLGLIFAAPMLVVLYVMVKRLYVREALGTATPVPGEDEDGS